MDEPELALVTGGADFIGSHLVEGLRVLVLDNLATGREARPTCRTCTDGSSGSSGTQPTSRHLESLLGEVFNVGTTERIRRLELVDTVNRIYGPEIRPGFQPPPEGDVRDSLASRERINGCSAAGRWSPWTRD